MSMTTRSSRSFNGDKPAKTREETTSFVVAGIHGGGLPTFHQSFTFSTLVQGQILTPSFRIRNTFLHV
ncbi:hypothetical protein Peur_034048 [Populus x canadensis]